MVTGEAEDKSVGQPESRLSERNGNLIIMDGLEKKYPYAFESSIDEKGRKVLIMKPVNIQAHPFGFDITVLTEVGYATVGTYGIGIDQLNITALVDYVESKGDDLGKGDGDLEESDQRRILKQGAEKHNTRPMRGPIAINPIDLSRSDVRAKFSKALGAANIKGYKEANEETESGTEGLSPEAVLSEL